MWPVFPSYPNRHMDSLFQERDGHVFLAVLSGTLCGLFKEVGDVCSMCCEVTKSTTLELLMQGGTRVKGNGEGR